MWGGCGPPRPPGPYAYGCENLQVTTFVHILSNLLTSLTSEKSLYSIEVKNSTQHTWFDSCEKFLKYANSSNNSSWQLSQGQLFRKFAFVRTAQVILCVKTLKCSNDVFHHLNSKSCQLTLVELEKQSMTFRLVSGQYLRIMNTISEQEISHVTEGRVCLQPCMGLQLIVIKPSGRVSTESFDVTK